MVNFELTDGNGQEVYFDASLFYFNPSWIDEKRHAIFIPDFTGLNPVYESYRKIFNMLYEKGYKVICDSKKVSEDTFFFTPCFDKHVNKTKEEYCRKKRIKVLECLLNYGIEEPISVGFSTCSFPNDIPELPLVLKNENEQCGTEKFLIKTEEQLELLKKFYAEINDYDREIAIKKVKQQRGLGDDVVFDKDGHSNSIWSISFVDYKKEFYENMRLQKYIKTPTKYNTSLRVLTSSSGDILGASLKYSEPSVLSSSGNYNGLFDKYLSNPNSLYYLSTDSIVSNTFSGGSSILLEKDNYSSLEREILLSHDIDPFNALVPDSVAKAAISVAVNCKHEIGAICGMDFIYDVESKRWKYLEEHSYPMLYTYAEKYGIAYNSNSSKFRQDTEVLDLMARMHALSLTMDKNKKLGMQYKKNKNIF